MSSCGGLRELLQMITATLMLWHAARRLEVSSRAQQVPCRHGHSGNSPGAALPARGLVVAGQGRPRPLMACQESACFYLQPPFETRHLPPSKAANCLPNLSRRAVCLFFSCQERAMCVRGMAGSWQHGRPLVRCAFPALDSSAADRPSPPITTPATVTPAAPVLEIYD